MTLVCESGSSGDVGDGSVRVQQLPARRAIPATLHASLLARLDRLGAATNRVNPDGVRQFGQGDMLAITIVQNFAHLPQPVRPTLLAVAEMWPEGFRKQFEP